MDKRRPRIVLFEPEIPPNTGNVARLCAAMNVELHLIEPLGFRLDNRYLRRAGLDYWPHVNMFTWSSWRDFAFRIGRPADERWIMTSARRRGTSTPLQRFAFRPCDCLVFGPETRGLPADVLDCSVFHVHIPACPMAQGGVRSLNLSTAAGIVLYAALAGIGGLEKWS